jgi:hypothetical protein
MGVLRRRRLRPDIAAIIFSCDESDLARFSIATGPCVPLMEGGKSLLSPLTQHGGETPALTACLYTALTGHPADGALLPVDKLGKGRLSLCSDDFVNAMAASCEESLRLAGADEARGDEDLPSFSQHQEAVGAAWMRVGHWPREVVSLTNRLVRLGTAREAMAAGHHLFAWHGPSVPQFVVTSGQGPYSPPE